MHLEPLRALMCGVVMTPSAPKRPRPMHAKQSTTPFKLQHLHQLVLAVGQVVDTPTLLHFQVMELAILKVSAYSYPLSRHCHCLQKKNCKKTVLSWEKKLRKLSPHSNIGWKYFIEKELFKRYTDGETKDFETTEFESKDFESTEFESRGKGYHRFLTHRIWYHRQKIPQNLIPQILNP